jgi:hypothetical protein
MSQADTITLAVDTANTGSTTNKVYSRFREELNKTTYRGPEGTLANRQEMAFLRKDPTRNGNSNGVATATIRFTDDVSVAGVDTTTTVEHLLVGEVSFRIPVGVSDADLLAFRQRLIAILDDDTVMTDLMGSLEI